MRWRALFILKKVMKSTLSYPIYIYMLLHNWKHGFDKTDCVLFSSLLSSYMCVCVCVVCVCVCVCVCCVCVFLGRSDSSYLASTLWTIKIPFQSTAGCWAWGLGWAFLGTALWRPGEYLQLTHDVEKSPCRSCPPYRPCGQTISHLFRAKSKSDQVKPSPILLLTQISIIQKKSVNYDLPIFPIV